MDNGQNIPIYRTANYVAGELFVTRICDEEGNTSYEFRDKLGQTILTRQLCEGKLHDTYYLYDVYGNLKAVLPPEASDKLTNAASTSAWTDTNTHLQQFAYLYKYDSGRRCIARKIPGCEWVYLIYDKADRLIFTQDGEQRKRGEWLFTLPDVFGRVCVTGLCKNTLNAPAETTLNNVVTVARDNTTAAYKGYSAPSGITLSAPQLLSVNYYDDYAFLNKSAIPEFNNTDFAYESLSGYHTWYSASAKTLLTGTLVAKLEGSVSSFLGSAMYYDSRARIIQTRSGNHLGGMEKEYIAYTFTGLPVKSVHLHSAPGKVTQRKNTRMNTITPCA